MHADAYYMNFFSISFLVSSFMTSFCIIPLKSLLSTVMIMPLGPAFVHSLDTVHCVSVLPLHSSTGKQASWITDASGPIGKKPQWSHHYILPIFDLEQDLRELVKWRNELWIRRKGASSLQYFYIRNSNVLNKYQ